MIVFDPGNPHDFTDGGLEEFQVAMAQEFETDVIIDRREERGQGVTFVEILHIWIEAGEIASPAIIAKQVGGWLRTRRRSEAEITPKPRTRLADIYGPTGELLKSVRVENDTVQISEPSQDTKRERPRPPPPSRCG